jgi:hypothetical protein
MRTWSILSRGETARKIAAPEINRKDGSHPVHRATTESELTRSADRSIARGAEKPLASTTIGPPRRLDKQCLLIEVRIPDRAYRSARAPEFGRDHLRLLIIVTCALLRGWIDLRLLGCSGVRARSGASSPCAPAWASRSLGSRARPRKPPPFAEAAQ